MDIVFEAIAEDRPGPKWRSVYDRHWHAYSRWFLRDGIRSRPTYLASLKSLKAHMPELLPAYEAIVEMAGGGDLEARFLSMWCPPTYVGGCSQAIVAGPTPVLIRNYDYSPQLIEGTWFASRLNGKRVLGVVDCLWGLREASAEDAAFLKSSRITVFTMVEIDATGIREVMREAIRIASAGTKGIHVSYSPTVTEIPGSIEGSGGITVRETHQVMEAISTSGKMISMDVSPLPATLEPRVGATTTHFILSAFGKRIL